MKKQEIKTLKGIKKQINLCRKHSGNCCFIFLFLLIVSLFKSIFLPVAFAAGVLTILLDTDYRYWCTKKNIMENTK